MSDDSEIVKWGSHRLIRYNFSQASVSNERYKMLEADGVIISGRSGALVRSIEELRFLPDLRLVSIQDVDGISLDGLKNLSGLEELAISGSGYCIDFLEIPSLKTLSAHWSKELFKNIHASNLESLHLWKYRSVHNDLSDFPKFERLRILELIQSNIYSLNGLSDFKGLINLELNYLSRLEFIGQLELPNLISFKADKCSRLRDYNNLIHCDNIEELKLHHCGTIDTVKFIHHLKKLKTVRFMGTDIRDGDLSPLRHLHDVYFTNKRHFSHKTSDFSQIAPSWE